MQQRICTSLSLYCMFRRSCRNFVQERKHRIRQSHPHSTSAVRSCRGTDAKHFRITHPLTASVYSIRLPSPLTAPANRIRLPHLLIAPVYRYDRHQYKCNSEAHVFVSLAFVLVLAVTLYRRDHTASASRIRLPHPPSTSVVGQQLRIFA